MLNSFFSHNIETKFCRLSRCCIMLDFHLSKLETSRACLEKNWNFKKVLESQQTMKKFPIFLIKSWPFSFREKCSWCARSSSFRSFPSYMYRVLIRRRCWFPPTWWLWDATVSSFFVLHLFSNFSPFSSTHIATHSREKFILYGHRSLPYTSFWGRIATSRAAAGRRSGEGRRRRKYQRVKQQRLKSRRSLCCSGKRTISMFFFPLSRNFTRLGYWWIDNINEREQVSISRAVVRQQSAKVKSLELLWTTSKKKNCSRHVICTTCDFTSTVR